MKRILEKRQIQVIMLLSAVIFILACGVIYVVSSRHTGETVPSAAEKPPHELVRDARPSADERIAWETNFGGSGNETPSCILEKNGEFYVFGNTDSRDLDFAGAESEAFSGFGARFASSGKSKSFTRFEFSVAKALPTQEGFAVAGNRGSVAELYLLDDELTVVKVASMPALHALSACNLYVYDDCYFLFAESRDQVTGLTSLLLQVYSSDLKLVKEKLFKHSYSLKLLDMMPYGSGYVLAAAATYQNLGYLTVARFDTLTQPAYVDVELGYAYVPTSFIPFSSGYAAACDRGGNCELLVLDSSFKKTDVKFLTVNPNSNVKSVFYAGSTLVYDGEKLTELSDTGRTVGSIAFSPRSITDFGTNEVASFAVGGVDSGISLATLGKKESAVHDFEIAAPSRVLILPCDDCVILVSDCSAAGGACGDFFGGTDVWLAKINLLSLGKESRQRNF